MVKLFDFFMFYCFYVWRGEDNSIYLIELLWGLNVYVYVKVLG